MKVIVIGLSDIHGYADAVKDLKDDLAKADVILLTGDLTTFGGRNDAKRVVETIKGFNRNILAVPGNCDTPEIERYLTEAGINIHCRSIVFKDSVFMGIGGSLACPGHTPNEYSEKQMEDLLEKVSKGMGKDKPVIFVSHQPPAGTSLDAVFGGRHVGSKSVRNFIEKLQPLICFTGHIHEAAGIDSIGRTRLINPGPLKDGGYAYAKFNRDIKQLEIRRTEQR
jgi:uncharacterized protein